MRSSPSLAQQRQAAMGMNIGMGNVMSSFGFPGTRPDTSIAPGIQVQQQFATQQQSNVQQQLQPQHNDSKRLARSGAM